MELTTCRRLMGIVAVQEAKLSDELFSKGNTELTNRIYSSQFGFALEPEHRAVSSQVGLTLLYCQVLGHALYSAQSNQLEEDNVKKLKPFITNVMAEVHSRFLNCCVDSGEHSQHSCEPSSGSFCLNKPNITCVANLCMKLSKIAAQDNRGISRPFGIILMECLTQCTAYTIAPSLATCPASSTCTPQRPKRSTASESTRDWVLDEILTPYDSATRSGILDATLKDFVPCEALVSLAKCLIHALYECRHQLETSRDETCNHLLQAIASTLQIQLVAKAHQAFWALVYGALQGIEFPQAMQATYNAICKYAQVQATASLEDLSFGRGSKNRLEAS